MNKDHIYHDYTYLNQLKYVFHNGTLSTDRTGVGTISCFSPPEARYNLNNSFPLLTSKKIFTRGVIEELLWFLSGSTNNNDLVEKNVHIWDEWAHPNGQLGPIYGKQWRNWDGIKQYEYKDGERIKRDYPGVDQITDLVERIKREPDSRRLIVSAWNVSDLPSMALAPCHCFFQVYVREGTLSLKLYQRSADMFLGVPFNIASYAFLTHMLAAQTGYKAGEFIHSMGDAHIYLNHLNQVKEQLNRTPPKSPKLVLADAPDLFSYTFEHFSFTGYEPLPAIKGEVAV